MLRKLSFAFVLLAFIFTLGAPVAFAHAELVRSDPAADAVLATAPTAVRMWFDEDIDAQLSEIQVLDSSQTRVDKGDLALAPNDSKQIAVSLKPLSNGTYTVVWKVLSATDGHITRGTFAFSVGKPSAPIAPSSSSPAADTSGDNPLSVAARWLDLIGLLTVAGALFFRDLVLRPSLRANDLDYADLSRPTWQRLFVGALAIAFLGEILAVIFEAGLVTGAVSLDQVARVLFDTRFGILWITRWVALTVAGLLVLGVRTRASALIALGESAAIVVLYTGILADPRLVGQFGALSAALVQAGIVQHIPHIIPLFLFVAVIIFRDDTTRGLVAQLLILVVLLSIALGSHSAAEGVVSLPVLADWLHLIAVATWMGGLVTLTWMITPVWRSMPQAQRRPWLMAVVSRFSPLALVSVATIIVTGIYMARIQIPSVDALLGTLYGQTLDAKVLLFLVLFAMGAVQVLIMQNRIAHASSDQVARVGQGFRNLISAEVVVGLLVIGLAGLLSSSPPARVALAQSPPTPSARPQTVKLFAHPAPDLNLALDFSMASDSPQTADIVLTDAAGHAPAGVLRVILEFTLLDKDVGATRVNLDQGFNGRYVASGNYMTLPGMWQIGITVRRQGLPDISSAFPLLIPDPRASAATDPRALDWLQKSDRVMNSLHTLRSTQFLNDGANAVVITDYEYQAPDRMHFIIQGEGESVAIGGTQFYLENGNWTTQSRVEPFVFPNFQNAHATAIHLGRTEVVDNQTMQIVLTDQVDDPRVHFAYWIGTEDLRLHRLAMVAPAHYMIQTYYDYDAPVQIAAPPNP